MRQRTIFLAGLLVISAIVYWLALRAYYVGFFNDDAFFVIGARSLLEGGYRELNQPGTPPMVSYLPGYPLLLAPLVWLSSHNFVPCQVLSILFSLGAVALLGVTLRESETTPVWIATLALAALNPLTVSLSGTVLSDVPYLFFSSVILYLLVKGWLDRPSRAYALCAIAAFTFYLRPVGAAWCLAIVAALLLERRLAVAARTAALMAALILPFFIWTAQARGYWFMYGSEMSGAYRTNPLLTLIGSWLWQVPYYLREILVRDFFRWFDNRWYPVLSGITIGVGIIFVTLGAMGKCAGNRLCNRALMIYLFIYAVIHFSWHRQSGRYLLPVLPLVYLAFFRGTQQFDDRFRPRVKLTWAAFALSVALLAFPVKRILHVSQSLSLPINTPPETTFRWIRDHTAPGDVFAAELDGQLYLLTGRQAFSFPRELPPNQFGAWARNRGVSHILLMNTDIVMRSRNRDRSDPLPPTYFEQALKDKTRFSPVFSSPEERTAIYRAS